MIIINSSQPLVQSHVEGLGVEVPAVVRLEAGGGGRLLAPVLALGGAVLAGERVWGEGERSNCSKKNCRLIIISNVKYVASIR